MQPGYSSSSDPYAFLNQPKSSTSFSTIFARLSRRSKIVLGLVALVFIVIILVVAKAVFGGNKNVNLNSLYAVLGQEQELINLATIGSQQQQVASQSYLNFSYTTIGSATTDQTKLIGLLSYNHIKVGTGSYILQPSADKELNQVEQSSTFDSVYSSVMQTELNLYKQDLSQAYTLNKSSILRGYLATDYQDTNTLIKMLNSSYG